MAHTLKKALALFGALSLLTGLYSAEAAPLTDSSTAAAVSSPADADNNGTVDLHDLLVFAQSYFHALCCK